LADTRPRVVDIRLGSQTYSFNVVPFPGEEYVLDLRKDRVKA